MMAAKTFRNGKDGDQDDFAIAIEAKHSCARCNEVFKKLVGAVCGHRFCVVCFESVRRSSYTVLPQSSQGEMEAMEIDPNEPGKSIQETDRGSEETMISLEAMEIDLNEPGKSIQETERGSEETMISYMISYMQRVAELENENRELKKELMEKEQRMAELENENRELKKELERCTCRMEKGVCEKKTSKDPNIKAIMEQSQLNGIEMDVGSMEMPSYDGNFLWKITVSQARELSGVRDPRQEVGSSVPSATYSMPFFTERHGYKMRAKLYINGDGIGKGTHLSLFLVIMKGEYDAILQWPFKQELTFKLLDQDRHHTVVKTIQPDPTSCSFMRPTSEMNIASGCPTFISLGDLQNWSYIKDDTMFIQISVATAGFQLWGSEA